MQLLEITQNTIKTVCNLLANHVNHLMLCCDRNSTRKNSVHKLKRSTGRYLDQTKPTKPYRRSAQRIRRKFIHERGESVVI